MVKTDLAGDFRRDWEQKGKNRNGRGKNRDRFDRFDDEVDEFGPERNHKRIPLWAACALTGLAVTVLALFIGLCCLYKQHKKVMQQAQTQMASTGVPIPSPDVADSINESSQNSNFQQLPHYDASGIKKMNQF